MQKKLVSLAVNRWGRSMPDIIDQLVQRPSFDLLKITATNNAFDVTSTYQETSLSTAYAWCKRSGLIE